MITFGRMRIAFLLASAIIVIIGFIPGGVGITLASPTKSSETPSQVS